MSGLSSVLYPRPYFCVLIFWTVNFLVLKIPAFLWLMLEAAWAHDSGSLACLFFCILVGCTCFIELAEGSCVIWRKIPWRLMGWKYFASWFSRFKRGTPFRATSYASTSRNYVPELRCHALGTVCFYRGGFLFRGLWLEEGGGWWCVRSLTTLIGESAEMLTPFACCKCCNTQKVHRSHLYIGSGIKTHRLISWKQQWNKI